MKKILLMAGLLGMSLAAHAELTSLKPGGEKFALRQGPSELATFLSQPACEAAARDRTTNPGSIRQRFEIRSGGGAVLGTEATQEACLAAPQARLTAEGPNRPVPPKTKEGNVNSCVVTTTYSTDFQPPACVSTFNFIASYALPSTTEPEPPVPEPPLPCNCTCPALPRQATLTWRAPTQNTNGSTLTNLAGYWISYGRSANEQTSTIQIPSAATLQYTVPNLDVGTWYFSMRAYTTVGTESVSSSTVTKVVQ